MCDCYNIKKGGRRASCLRVRRGMYMLRKPDHNMSGVAVAKVLQLQIVTNTVLE